MLQAYSGWMGGKIRPMYAAYQMLTSTIKTLTDLRWGDGKSYSVQMEMKGNLLISDKIDFKTKTATRHKNNIT